MLRSQNNRAMPKAWAIIVLTIFVSSYASLALTSSALAQSDGCVLVPDDHNPSEKILQCGSNLTVREAPGTDYRVVSGVGQDLPRAIRLNAGALLLEFHPSVSQKNFEILTPHAVAAVRGTKWAVEVSAAMTSTLVLNGAVSVRHLNKRQGVILRMGQGADVTRANTPIVVKKWPAARVHALLARFGE